MLQCKHALVCGPTMCRGLPNSPVLYVVQARKVK